MNISGDGKKSILGFEDYNTIWQLIYFSFQNPDSPYWICRPAAKSNQKKREVEWSFGIFLVFILNFEEKSWFQWWNKTKKRLSFSNQNFIVKFFFLHIYTLICVLENYRFSPMCFYQVYISTILDYFI